MRQEIDIVADLKRQNLEHNRQIVYDGHNRRSVNSTVHDLKERRYRRRWNQKLAAIVQDMNSVRSN